MYTGKALEYNTFWHLLRKNKDVKYKVIAAGGNFSFLDVRRTEYIKIAEILDIDEEGPNGKNEAGYKTIYFETCEKDNKGNEVYAGGIPMDEWPSADYNIRVHNMYPLEIIVDWVDTEEGFRDIIILRDYEDKMIY
ncbi:MAG: hypothetical protein IJD58_11585 [Lachnospiraceae bacterium]|nr:hypothetical protein [Lachnospiraceae bacterium]